jgi:DNA-binding MarR family transcriptional regulator
MIRQVKDLVDELMPGWVAALPDLDVRIEGIVSRMQLVVRHLSERKAEAVAATGLQMWECATLYALRRRGRPYSAGPTELARELGVTGAAMTTRIDQLQRRGYVRRGTDPDDRRRNTVTLTGRGRQLSERIMAAQAAAEQDLVGSLTTAQQDELTGLLRRLMLAADLSSLDA